MHRKWSSSYTMRYWNPLQQAKPIFWHNSMLIVTMLMCFYEHMIMFLIFKLFDLFLRIDTTLKIWKDKCLFGCGWDQMIFIEGNSNAGLSCGRGCFSILETQEPKCALSCESDLFWKCQGIVNRSVKPLRKKLELRTKQQDRQKESGKQHKLSLTSAEKTTNHIIIRKYNDILK